MAKNLTLFDNHQDYLDYKNSDNYITPNVSYCKEENEVHYNPHHDYSQDYFTIVVKESGTVTFTGYVNVESDVFPSISYKKNNSEWITALYYPSINISVNNGDRIQWKSTNEISGGFRSDCAVDVEGNIMSLLYGDEFQDKKSLEGTYGFSYLFFSYNEETDESISLQIVNAQNLSLPATTLIDNCYKGMFYDCRSLITAPELPATTLASYCYYEMFCDCTSLITAPSLPATTLANYCYDAMFIGCTSLTNAPDTLPATTLANYCYGGMFQNCTSLTIAPTLPATTLASNCYNNMFTGCTSLTTAPELPATTLAERCYYYIFSGCISLTTAPVLPATTLANYCYGGMFSGCISLIAAPTLPATTLTGECYNSMFRGCTSLTTAPTLPAKTLVSRCYYYMFNGCSNLNYIKAMFTTTPGINHTGGWVQNVSSTGTFVKNSAAGWTTTGINGIPTGWTVQTASA